MLVNGEDALINAIISTATIPTPQTSDKKIYFGYKSIPSFNGNIMDLAGGQGGYLSRTNIVDNCVYTLGI